MIDYAQIVAQAEELSRQFWEEIEHELVRRSMSQPAAGYHLRWQYEPDVAMDNPGLDTSTRQSTIDECT
jgi:hypothetical protein